MAAPRVNLLFAGEVFEWLKKMLKDMIAAGELTVKINQDGEEKSFGFHLLPQKPGSFFIVNLYVRHSSIPRRPLPLLFSLHNLYLLGFQHANIWYFFDDADLSGSGHHLESNLKYWVKLGISGGYRGNMFNHVELGIEEIHNIYHVLSRYLECKSQGKHDNVDAALFRAIVVLPETWRFPSRRACLYRIFCYSPSVVDRNPEEGDDGYEKLFKIWKKICKRVLAGANEFHNFSALAGYNTYAQVLPVVSVLMRPKIKLNLLEM